ncbi:MAG: dTDP-4-dehydrorhamnose reductase [Dongiaceae bacterium]
MRILVIGSGGQVGTELMRTPWPPGTEVVGLPHSQLDITDATAVERAIRAAGCDLVVNAAGYTAVDRAESEAQAAFAVNRDGAAHVAAASASAGVPLIHLSTDYVFDGTKRGPYVEDDPVAPINVYGASKAAGEADVRRCAPRHIILRASWVYGAHGHNFVKTMLRLGRERREIRVVDDQTGSPTAAADLAVGIAKIAGKLPTLAEPWGTYHLCGAGATTWYEFARRIFELRSHSDTAPVVRPTSSADFAAAAGRPANSRLDCRRIEAVFGVTCPPWQASLARVLPDIEASPT